MVACWYNNGLVDDSLGGGILGGLIALIVWGITKLSRRNSSSQQRDPLDIAKERYAKGEISKEEFEQIKKGLS